MDGNSSLRRPCRCFLFLMLFRSLITSDAAAAGIVDVGVGVILDFDSPVGMIGNSTLAIALEDFYATLGRGYRTRLKFHYRDSQSSVTEAASAGTGFLTSLELIKADGVKAILIGPQTSEEVGFLPYIGSRAHVPVVSFTAVTSLPSPSQTPYFIRMAQSDLSQARPIATLLQAFNWKDVVLVHDDSYSGNALIPYLTDAIQEVGSTIRLRRIILPPEPDETIIRQKMNELSAAKARIFIVHLPVSICGTFFQEANEAGMMVEGYAWVVTSRIADLVKTLDPSLMSSMEGVLGVKTYVRESVPLNNFKQRWKRRFREEHPEQEVADLDVYAVWAYDATWALALATEKALSPRLVVRQVHQEHRHPPKAEGDHQSSGSKYMGMEVSPVGSNILQALLNTRFNGGLSGDQMISLPGGSLNSSNTFEIINLVSGSAGGRKLGYWTPNYGLSRSLRSSSKEKNYSAKVEDLAGIIWPGGFTSVPNESLITSLNVTLRILYPLKIGFKEFVMRGERDATEGYSVEVFRAAMDAMPYKVQLDFQPFNRGDINDARYYDNLISQVFLKKYDAVVGDTTIVGNRSNYVDFTQPYTDPGVTMIVPVVDNDLTKKLWWFFVPLSKGLWLATIGISVLKGVLIWIFEHSTNKKFQGTKSEQIGKILYFSFTVFQLSNGEELKTNYARFISGLWTFVVFVLVTSYGANLTSILTVEKLRPKVTDLQTLIKNKESIGYQAGSFVLEFLKEQGAVESNLIPLGSADEYAKALNLGSGAKGGVSAIVDEIPYIRVFLKSYCRNYTMAGKTYRTGGFGFVFPRGSAMVSDVSRAILQLISSVKMTQIEDKWFGNLTCLNPLQTTDSGYELSFSSFSFIYLTTLCVSAVTVIIYCMNFKYEERNRARVAAVELVPR